MPKKKLTRPSTIEEVAGGLRFKGKAKSTAQMRTAIRREVVRRHQNGRY